MIDPHGDSHPVEPQQPAPPGAEERGRLRSMLTRPLREIPPIYFYDDHGSHLFEQITLLPEYYPTRTEISILEEHARGIIAAARPRHLVELGSGAGRKIRLLLDAWRGARLGESCTMLDVNALFLARSVRELRSLYPGYHHRGITGDFTRDLHLLGAGGERLIVFFGSTIGNLYPDERATFFRSLSRVMAPSDTLLLGVDLVKDTARLEAAYNDSQGVTAEFNRSALRTLNRRFGADFDVGSFAHRAFYDARSAWIEMRLRAERPMQVRIRGLDLTLDLARGDEIRTEVSCKFTRDSLAASAAQGGLALSRFHTDPEGLFALALLGRAKTS